MKFKKRGAKFCNILSYKSEQYATGIGIYDCHLYM